ncbi:MAG: flavin reductase [Bacteroidales bacterium]|nr:flavin reductase [Bacteroidales bacterium]
MKIKLLVPYLFFVLMTFSCTNNRTEDAGSETTTENSENMENGKEGQSGYERLDPKELPDNVIELIGKQWMLVTAGTSESFNTMTASWGGIGYIWERPSTFIFIRDTRYTYQFLQQEESFTLSFFPEEYRHALRICGSRSGRDTDKIKEAGLTPIQTSSGLMSFAEARMIIECRKILVQELHYENLTSPYKEKIIKESYDKESAKHQMFISEITNIWLKK